MDKRLLWLSPIEGLADLVMPRQCCICGRELQAGEDCICIPCLLDLPLARLGNMERNSMALRYNERINSSCAEYEPFQRAMALLIYEADSPYSAIPRALKYRHAFAEGKYFARMLGECLASSPLFADVDLVVPVPLHWTRKLRRGYNQAEIIAREVAQCLGARLETGFIVRARRTRTQTRLKDRQPVKESSGARSRLAEGYFLPKTFFAAAAT